MSGNMPTTNIEAIRIRADTKSMTGAFGNQASSHRMTFTTVMVRQLGRRLEDRGPDCKNGNCVQNCENQADACDCGQERQGRHRRRENGCIKDR